MLDGVSLGQQGIEAINNNDALSLTVLAAVTFTLDLPPTDTNPAGHRPRVHSLDCAPMPPKAVVVGCGEGGSIRALEDIFEFTGVTDHDWTHPGGQTSWKKDSKAQQEQLPPLPTPSSSPKPTSGYWKVRRASSSRQLGQTTPHHSCQPQATAGKRSKCQPDRLGSSQPREKHSSIESDTIKARRNASLGGGPD